MPLWYLSFATKNKFLGATVVTGEDAEDALEQASSRGLNPGGEVAIWQLPPEAENDPDMLRLRDRLASRDEMMAQGGRRLGDLPEDVADEIEDASIKVCGACNT